MEIPKDKILINPQEVMALTGLEYDCACKIIRELNEKLKAKGFQTDDRPMNLEGYLGGRGGGNYGSI